MERIGVREIGGMIVDIVYGFLGSGKTTFITRILKEWSGVPSGCICLTLKVGKL
jgi:G3E family GTPase